MARPYVALVALALVVAPTAPRAQTWSGVTWTPLPGAEPRVERFPVGAGMYAERTWLCGGRWQPGVPCSFQGWRPVGFVFGTRPDLARALTFSGDGRGRILAATERDVLYSDNRGLSWQRAAFNGITRPQLLAMEPETRFGVALADGAVHVTEDGGASWRFVREIPSRRLTQAVVLGRNALLTDGNGVWALVNGGELLVLSEAGANSAQGAPPQLQVTEGALVASDREGRAWRVLPRGTIERLEGATWWGR